MTHPLFTTVGDSQDWIKIHGATREGIEAGAEHMKAHVTVPFVDIDMAMVCVERATSEGRSYGFAQQPTAPINWRKRQTTVSFSVNADGDATMMVKRLN